ncbi:hypothetical protein [Sorangium sp. So ce426]|uniref:hypothetical protein n=1 Tax=Sorangium sp. So ce426 TaxID=3133312 RepID=UPI003F5B51F1
MSVSPVTTLRTIAAWNPEPSKTTAEHLMVALASARKLAIALRAGAGGNDAPLSMRVSSPMPRGCFLANYAHASLRWRAPSSVVSRRQMTQKIRCQEART